MSSSSQLGRGEKRRITFLRRALLGWFALNARPFPWRRGDASTFEQICVEVLLQRTRAETVSRAYAGFFGRFGGWDEIARAPVAELEEHFRPLGLWQRRARSIKALAAYAADRGGRFPSTDAALADVPAVGQYVANAIRLFQHGKPGPLLDVNMARLLERYLRPRDLADIRQDPWLQQASHWLVRDDAVATNWATLDFAAAICKARSPLCSQCPVVKTCNYIK